MAKPMSIEKAEMILNKIKLTGMSRCEIARCHGLNVATVAIIANGQWFEAYYKREERRRSREKQKKLGDYHRCPGCSKLVTLPCLYCKIRALNVNASRFSDRSLRTETETLESGEGVCRTYRRDVASLAPDLPGDAEERRLGIERKLERS